MNFKNWSIFQKFIVTIAFMAIVAIGVAFVGSRQIQNLDMTLRNVGLREASAREAMDLRIDIIAISRMTYQLALAPEKASDFRAEAERRMKEMKARFPTLRATANAGESALLDAIEVALDGYFTAIRALTDAATANAADAQAIRKALGTALERQKAVTDAVKIYSTTTDKAMSQSRGDAESRAADASMVMVAAPIAGIILGLAAAFAVGQLGIVRPIRRLTASMRALSQGDLDVAVSDTNRKDEIGVMADTIEVFRRSMARNAELEREAEQARSTMAAQRRAVMAELADSFEQSVGGVTQTMSGAVRQLQDTASALSGTADLAAQKSRDVAQSAQIASQNAVTVAGATEELGASVTEIARQVEASARMSEEAVQEASQTRHIVQELAQSTVRIGDVVNLISAIASQTNLLALNATIEAARAGEAGRGFAVVASEVKALASQTAKATEEIVSQIGAVQSATDQAVSAISHVTDTIQSMSRIGQSISSSVEQQGIATSEIVTSVAQASRGTNEVSSLISGVAQAADHTGAASARVLASSADLAAQAEILNTRVREFLHSVRAA